MKNEVNRASRRRGAKKGNCKSLLIKERQQARTKRKKSRKLRRPLPPVEYEAIYENPRVLKLRNGVELRQAISGVGLYFSQSGRVYSLTAFGLRPRRTRFLKKNNYCKKTSGGTAQGQRYPYIIFQGRKYEVHILVTLAWLRPRREGEEIDHIAINELIKKAVFYEIKRNEKELDLPLLEQRTNTFLVSTRELKKYAISSTGLSLIDM